MLNLDMGKPWDRLEWNFMQRSWILLKMDHKLDNYHQLTEFLGIFFILRKCIRQWNSPFQYIFILWQILENLIMELNI